MTPPAKKASVKVSGTPEEPQAVQNAEDEAEDKLEAAKAKADEGAPPAKRATKLSRHPELQDEAWVAGNPVQAKALRDS